MKHLIYLFFLFSAQMHAQEQVTHAVLIGAWSYFYITTDSFAQDKNIATEQRLIFRDGQNVTLNIVAKEQEYFQNTSYELKYALSLRDNVPYLTLFSPESKEILGAYVRMPLDNALELASDPGFTKQSQLYKRNSILLPGQISRPQRGPKVTSPR
ncbi:hypothetical protein SAMN02745150_00447 [Brevinema andersonii]|uniref:Uncharacterized protein n=1 Tax=Brevinema andersonii TaxID=34097 RepID=A0A1I1DG53_BREAD|nr:hypothetical protein [Brevinema andersonii]SFB71740.1 hypothetical protein SAMN02745150_00447 [Brevinema andersonii]